MAAKTIQRVLRYFRETICSGQEAAAGACSVRSMQVAPDARRELVAHVFFQADNVVAAARPDLVQPLCYLLDHIDRPMDLLRDGTRRALLDISQPECRDGSLGICVERVLYATNTSTRAASSGSVRTPTDEELGLLEDLVRRADRPESARRLRDAVEVCAHFRAGSPTACAFAEAAEDTEDVLRVNGPFAHARAAPLQASELVLLAVAKRILQRGLVPLYSRLAHDAAGILRAVEAGYISAGWYLRVQRGPATPNEEEAGGADGSCTAVDSVLTFVEGMSEPRQCGSDGLRQAQAQLLAMLAAAGVQAQRERFAYDMLCAQDANLVFGDDAVPVDPVVLPWVEEFKHWMGVETSACEVRGVLGASTTGSGPAGVRIEAFEECQIDAITASRAAARLFLFPEEPRLHAHLLAADRWIPSAYVPQDHREAVRHAYGQVCDLQWGVSRRRTWLHNVVADIPGSEIRDQWVVAGAHLDTFPGTVGAADDAAGCGVLLEIARRLAHQPARRNVRLVWFTGEELDRCGSQMYVKRHRGELPQHVLYLNVDGGFRLTSTSAELLADELPDEFRNWVQRSLGLEAPYVRLEEGLPLVSDVVALSDGGVMALNLGGKRLTPPPRPHLPTDTLARIDKGKTLTILRAAAALVRNAADAMESPDWWRREHICE